MDWTHLLQQVVGSMFFGLVGIVLFVVAIRVLQKVLPFSIMKEIEQDQNVALGVVMGAVLLGLAIIVAAAIHG